MNSSMITAMVSMNAMQQKLDLIADNIANLNTAGYKRKDATFEDLLTNIKQQDERFAQPGRLTPLGFTNGWGARLAQLQPDLSQGPLQVTDNLYDVAIQGSALFEVITNDAGARAYTRNGAFQAMLNDAGDIVVTTADGYPVVVRTEGGEEPLILPGGYTPRIDAFGNVSAVSADGSDVLEIGQLKLVAPVKPGVLTAAADNLFLVADGLNVDEVVSDVLPATDNEVRLAQGYLEQSNVRLEQEMAELIMVQRAYQLSARALSSSDTMMSLANGLRA